MSKARGLADLGNVYDGGALSNRNLIINGGMQVAQRGTSKAGVTSGGHFVCDRWVYDGTDDATYTIEQSTDAPDGFGYSYKLTATVADTSIASNDWGVVSYRFEGQDLQHLSFGTPEAKKLTISFWVKASTAGSSSFSMFQDDGNRYYNAQYTINAVNTWEYKSITVSLPTSGAALPNDATRALRVYWGLCAGSDYTTGTTGTWGNISNWLVGQDNFVGATNATFQITGVQLEVGDTATPFEHRSYGDELQRCQRYYEEYISGWAGDGGNQQVSFRVEKRASPTVTVTQGSAAYLRTGGFRWDRAGDSTTEGYEADAEL